MRTRSVEWLLRPGDPWTSGSVQRSASAPQADSARLVPDEEEPGDGAGSGAGALFACFPGGSAPSHRRGPDPAGACALSGKGTAGPPQLAGTVLLF
ncbi:hypothetical protein GCM10010466_62660 [Planomonospora alba]|uniref:Uncharacterized protein n=1 Tax=Planomonospora alba TaxID=161354 RepID=A0ABP6P005_9ACTN